MTSTLVIRLIKNYGLNYLEKVTSIRGTNSYKPFTIVSNTNFITNFAETVHMPDLVGYELHHWTVEELLEELHKQGLV